MSRKLRWRLVHSCKHHIGFGSQSDRRTPLLDGFHGVLHLMEPSCGAPCGDIRIILIPEHPSKRFLPAPPPPPAILRRHFLYPVPLEFHSYKLNEEDDEEGGEFSYWANSTQKRWKNPSREEEDDGRCADGAKLATHRPDERRERERTGERESVSLPDLAQDLDRFGTRPRSRSPFSTTLLEFSFNLFIHEHSNHPTSIWNFHQNHFWHI